MTLVLGIDLSELYVVRLGVYKDGAKKEYDKV